VHEFVALPGLHGPLPTETITVTVGVNEYVLDIPALTSNYRCIYGQGCQGTTPLMGEGPGRYRPADVSVTGCCRVGPGYHVATAEIGDRDPAACDSPARIAGYVAQLGAEDAQHHERIAAGDWFTETLTDKGIWRSRTSTVEGNCIFLNTDMTNGKSGCALHHLARRLGVDPKLTKPQVCHTEPAAAFLIADDLTDGGNRVLVTLRPPWFGWFADTGYFCTTDPAAYSAAEPVFRRMASEFTTLLGEEVYGQLSAALEQLWAERGTRATANWGRPAALRPPKCMR
jgi:hypothetical protein